MLGRWSAHRHEPIVAMPPADGIATYEKIAANAVMAGCLPSYFPIVLTAVEALAQPDFRAYDLLTTVHSMGPLMVVSGPIADCVGMNGGANALGQGNRANATIGRALALCASNIGGARPGGLDPGTIGHPGKYTYCYTENTELSPWPALSVERGYSENDSTVTLYAADAPLCVAEMGTPSPEHVLRTIAECARIPGTYNTFTRGELWLVMSPEHARIVDSGGWGRREIGEYLYEHVRIRAGDLRDRGLYGFADSLTRPEWLDDTKPDELVPIIRGPEEVVVTVAGGGYGGYTAIVFGDIGGSITRRVEAA